jgi:FkbM family methyltransferase
VDTLSPHLQTVIDVGANRGDWTAYVLGRCPTVRAFCFELAQPTRDKLGARFAHVQNVTVMDTGLWRCRTSLDIKYYLGDDRKTSVFDYPHTEHSEKRRETVQTGDEFLATRCIDHVELLKVDAEGADFSILQGFEKALDRCAISVVQFEYGYACVLAKTFLLNFYELLYDYGYRIGRLHRAHVEFEHYRLESENFFGPNFVAVHESNTDTIRLLKG